MNSLYVSMSNRIEGKEDKKNYKGTIINVNNNCITIGTPMIELKYFTRIFLFMINQINSVLREE